MTSPGSIGAPAEPLIAAMASRSLANTRAGPVSRYTPSSSRARGSMAVLLITLPPGARLPSGKQTVDVIPLAPRPIGRADDVVRIDPVRLEEAGSQPRTAFARLPLVEHVVPRPPRDRHRVAVEEPSAPQVQHHLGHTPGQEDANRHVVRRAVRQRIDEAGHRTVDACANPRPSVGAGRRSARSQGYGAGGSSSLRTPRARASRFR